MNKKCKKIYNIRDNSFLEKYTKMPIWQVFEIIKCFICYEFKATKTREYMQSEKNVNIINIVILKIFNNIRNLIYCYLQLVYQTEEFATYNKWKYYSLDESLFVHDINHEQIWIL